MKITLGIDLGGSTTKIAALDDRHTMIARQQVKAINQAADVDTAVQHFLDMHDLSFSKISEIALTGVGASFIDTNICRIPTHKTAEFDAIGCGGLFLSGLKEALVVSMGTGTAFVKADESESVHIGGSGIGGGTLLGLSSALFQESNVSSIVKLAENGDLHQVDLTISDICKNSLSFLSPDVTAANFGKVEASAEKADLALGLINSIYQTVGILAAFACMHTSIKNIVVTGSMASIQQGQEILHGVGGMYGIRFIIPENAAYATALGATLKGEV